MKDTIKSPSIDTGIDVTKMHGHMDIYLTDIKTGKVEEVHEDNMMTNALQELFRNCGFLNYPDVDQNNMVTELLGGVMGFSEEIDEDATILHVPAGNKMVFNGSIGVLNNSAPTELGSYSADESGWQQDGSYVQTYDYSTSQANGTISCVCLTSKDYGYIGEGNATSMVSHATKRYIPFVGNSYQVAIPPMIFHVDLSDSSCYSFKIETVEEEQGGETVTVKKGFLRKYRIPASKLNIKGTPNAPIMLSETVVNIDSDLADAKILYQPLDGKLLLWNVQYQPVTQKWGTDWTQYIWTVQTNGTITKQEIINTSGNPDLYGLQVALFDGNYCFFLGNPESYWERYDTSTIYLLNRANGVISIINNPNGRIIGSTSWIRGEFGELGFILEHGTGDGRVVTTTGTPGIQTYVLDAVNQEAYPTNELGSQYMYHPVSRLIRFADRKASTTGYALFIVRDGSYIASINNLDNPVVKTSDKTMKVIYRITFDEQ